MQLDAWFYRECSPAVSLYTVNILFLPTPHRGLLRDGGMNADPLSCYVAHIASRLELVLLASSEPMSYNQEPSQTQPVLH